jgi:hypothetical protein
MNPPCSGTSRYAAAPAAWARQPHVRRQDLTRERSDGRME